MLKNLFLNFLFLSMVLFTYNSSYAHPGKTDSLGCHKDDTSSEEEHCHVIDTPNIIEVPDSFYELPSIQKRKAVEAIRRQRLQDADLIEIPDSLYEYLISGEKHYNPSDTERHKTITIPRGIYEGLEAQKLNLLKIPPQAPLRDRQIR